MPVTDYTPHGLVGMLAAGVGWVFRQHVKTDENRYYELTKSLDELSNQQTKNHEEVLKLLLADAQHRAK